MRPAELGPGDGLLTPDEQELLKRVERSRVWKLIRDSLCMMREELFAGTSSLSGLVGQPDTNQALWQQRGAILLIQHLLQEGPRCVVWYERYMAEQKEQKTREKGTVKRPEREYSARPEFDERPEEFDL